MMIRRRRTWGASLGCAAAVAMVFALAGCDPPEPSGDDDSEAAAIDEADFELQGNASNGESIYARQCASCHGQQGDGTGPAGGALNPPPTDFTAVDMSPAETFAVIRDGGPAAGKSAVMPGFERNLDEQELHDVTAYTLQFAE